MKILETAKDSKQPVDHGKAVTLALLAFEKQPADLADHLGITRQHLHRMKDQKSIHPDRLDKIAEFFGITLEELLSVAATPVTWMVRHQGDRVCEYLRNKNPKHGQYVRNIEDIYSTLWHQIHQLELS
jgi:DNA-binding Xre family transcriptional regulator